MGIVSGLDVSTLALWADYSHWNGQIDLAKTQPWLKGIFTKASDGKRMYEGSGLDLENYKDRTLNRNVQQAYDVGIPCIPYHYLHFELDAGWTLQSIVDWQFRVFTNALKGLVPGKSFHALALDIEETKGGNTNARWITEQMYNRLTEKYPGIPIIFYSRLTILDQLPALRDWLSFQGAGRNLWLAQWVYTQRIPVVWEKLHADYINRLNMTVRTPGYADWRFVQWSACFELPGCDVNYTDLNFYRGTTEQCYEWLKFKKSTTPPPRPPVQPQPDTELAKKVERLEDEVASLSGQLAQVKNEIAILVNWAGGLALKK